MTDIGYHTRTWISIDEDPEDEYTLIVRSGTFDGIEERVDLSPSPTWPSPAESSDLVADAVRRVMDRAWEAASGEPVIRP